MSSVMRTKLVFTVVSILFATGCTAKEGGYTAKARKEMEATVKLSLLSDKHFCKVFKCTHRTKPKTVREVPDIILDAQKAACKRLERQ